MQRLNALRLALVAIVAAAVLATPASAAPLRAPSGLAPAHEANVPTMPTFKWNAVKNAARYEFQLSATRNFSSLVSGRLGAVGTVKTLNTAATIDRAQPDGTYFWRVRAVSRAGRAGRWTAPRAVLKRWDLAPNLLSPINAETVSYPEQPLALRWAPVTGALKYEVDVATDPSLSTPAFRTSRRTIETAATVLTMQGTLSPGQYYWAVTPLDARGNRGVRSEVQSFTWAWNSGSRPDPVTDLDPRPEVFDPLLTWSPVGGAARYEVEINTSDVWAPGSKVCCEEAPLATSFAPQKVLSNNRFFWRVRAVDSSGNVGVWSVGPPFEKIFNPGVPTIRNLVMGDESFIYDLEDGVPEVTNPLVTWDPVPGAASYEVQVMPYEELVVGQPSSKRCNWTSKGSDAYDVKTATAAWTPLSGQWNGRLPGGVSYPRASYDATRALQDGEPYCVRVLARSDRDTKGQEVVSDWTQLRGPDQGYPPAFIYDAPTVEQVAPPPTPDSHYGEPLFGSSTARMPYFTWAQVPGAKSYFVVVARDPGFTNIVDVSITWSTVYAPRTALEAKTYPDEVTHYYWAVMPASGQDGNGVSTVPQDNSPQSFLKQSVPPAQLMPADGAVVEGQPQFRWTPAEAARSYRLQVSSDPSFGNIVDEVQTSSTAHTALGTYPVDQALYWRVRATDETGVGLTWSATRSFRRTLPTPTLDPANPTGGTVIPQLKWSAVPGAVAYDLAVDQADGTKKDFRMPTPSFTPVTFYGTGVWSFRVRAVFPGKSSQVVTGPYTPRTPFARSIGIPSSAKTDVRRNRLLLMWEHAPGVRSYRVELAKTTSFERPLDTREVDGTSYAPTLEVPDLRAGKVYWRVAGLDEGNNRGGWKVGSFSAGASLKVSLKGRLRRGRTSNLRVTVRDGKKIVRGASIVVTGAGLNNRATTNRKGRATLRLKPTRKGTIEIKVSTVDGRFGRATPRVR